MTQSATETSYDQYREAPTTEAFAALNKLVEKAKITQLNIRQAEADLEYEKGQLRRIITADIPNLCKEMGLKAFTTADGTKISIAEEINAHISKENEDAAFKWLEENGHSGLLKRVLSVAFNKDQEEEAGKLADELRIKYAGVVEKRSVHPSTLKAWVKEQLHSGKAIPMKEFGVFCQDVAKLPELR